MKLFKLSCLFMLFSVGLHAQTLTNAFEINMSGIIAQRVKMTLIANNVANGMTLRDDATGLPYQKQWAELQATEKGVKVVSIQKSQDPFGRYYDPSVPQSDEDGFIYLPNVNMPDEMVTLKHSEALFEANINAFKLTKTMYQSATDLLK